MSLKNKFCENKVVNLDLIIEKYYKKEVKLYIKYSGYYINFNGPKHIYLVIGVYKQKNYVLFSFVGYWEENLVKWLLDFLEWSKSKNKIDNQFVGQLYDNNGPTYDSLSFEHNFSDYKNNIIQFENIVINGNPSSLLIIPNEAWKARFFEIECWSTNLGIVRYHKIYDNCYNDFIHKNILDLEAVLPVFIENLANKRKKIFAYNKHFFFRQNW